MKIYSFGFWLNKRKFLFQGHDTLHVTAIFIRCKLNIARRLTKMQDGFVIPLNDTFGLILTRLSIPFSLLLFFVVA